MLRYSDELQAGSAREVLFFRPGLADNDEQSIPENMRLRVRSADGRLLSENDDCVWNATARRLELALDLSDPRRKARSGRYTAEVEFDWKGERRVFDFSFDIVPHPWRPNLAVSDLLALVPSVGFAGDEGGHLAALAAEAEEQLRLRIRAAGMTPGLIGNRAALDQCLRALTLSLACQRASRNAARDGLWNKHLSWQAAYESKWRELAASMRYDGDADGAGNQTGRDMAAVRLRP